MKKILSLLTVIVLSISVFAESVMPLADVEAAIATYSVYAGEMTSFTYNENITSVNSSDESVVSAENDGKEVQITAKKQGSAVVSVYLANQTVPRQYQFQVLDNSGIVRYKFIKKIAEDEFVYEVYNNTDINFWRIDFATMVNDKEVLSIFPIVYDLPAKGKAICNITTWNPQNPKSLRLKVATVVRRKAFENGENIDPKYFPTKASAEIKKDKYGDKIAKMNFRIKNNFSRKMGMVINYYVYNEKGKLLYGDQAVIKVIKPGASRVYKITKEDIVKKNTKKIKVKYWITCTSRGY